MGSEERALVQAERGAAYMPAMGLRQAHERSVALGLKGGWRWRH